MTEEHPRQNEGKQEPLADPVQALPIVVTPPVTAEIAQRHFKMFLVSEDELDTIASQSNSFHLSFCTGCAGVAATLWVELAGAYADQKHPWMFATAVMVSILTVWVLAFYLRDRIRWQRTVHALKKGSATERAKVQTNAK
jgi:hypothetical protein